MASKKPQGELSESVASENATQLTDDTDIQVLVKRSFNDFGVHDEARYKECKRILTDNDYNTLGDLKENMPTYEKWDAFCYTRKISDRFMKAAVKYLGFREKVHNESEREDGTKRRKLEHAVDKMQRLLEAMRDSTDTNGLTELDGDGEMWMEAKLILQRQCYIDTLNGIVKNFRERTETTYTQPVYTITGTPGIGKTTFRFWILLQWVKGIDLFLKDFSTILFSDGDETVYEITRTEEEAFAVTCVHYDKDVFSGKSKGRIGVLEMPEKLPIADKQLFGMELLILTGSPSRFQGGNEIMKVSSECGSSCLPLWEIAELHKLPLKIYNLKATDEEEQKTELANKFEEFGGVLRLLSLSNQEAMRKLFVAMNDVTIDFIRQVLTGSLPTTTTKFVHRLVELKGSDMGPKIVGFISDEVFKKTVAKVAQRQREATADYVKGLTDQGAKGCFFEAMFYRDVTSELDIEIKYMLGNRELTLETADWVTESYTFDDVPTEGFLYKPTKANFHGLDFFFIKELNTASSNSSRKCADLFMLQTTVSDDGHGSLDFRNPDIDKLLKGVMKTYSINKRIVIYVLPYKKDTFSVPELTNPRARYDFVCMGWTDPSIGGFERPPRNSS